jgi:hypothetical protein
MLQSVYMWFLYELIYLCLQMADLSDLETELESASVQDRILYEAALLELQHGTIPCRVLRYTLSQQNKQLFPDSCLIDM